MSWNPGCAWRLSNETDEAEGRMIGVMTGRDARGGPESERSRRSHVPAGGGLVLWKASLTGDPSIEPSDVEVTSNLERRWRVVGGGWLNKWGWARSGWRQARHTACKSLDLSMFTG